MAPFPQMQEVVAAETETGREKRERARDSKRNRLSSLKAAGESHLPGLTLVLHGPFSFFPGLLHMVHCVHDIQLYVI